MKEYRLYLIHIRDCLTRVKDYTSTGKDSFYEQMLIQDAVLRNLEVMCESIKKLPDEWKASEPNTPWHKIVGFRNKLAHQYLDVDLDVVWDIVENYLPELEISIEKIAERFWR
ncbi:MAG: HepT-like ribonuclease domain-containing protein [Planktothrix sp.]